MQNVNTLPAQAIELNDIHVPEQISSFPIAYGWWLLATLIIIIIAITLLKIVKRSKINAIKKQALKQLANSTSLSTDQTIAIIKWAAMHYFSREELAKLFGNSLQQFLVSTLPIKHQKHFSELSNEAFLNQYQTPSDDVHEASTNENFIQAANLWLTHALPPKAMKSPYEKTIQNHNKSVNVEDVTKRGANS